MDIWWKAAATAGTMAVVILTARHAHRRLAGLVAAFPTATAPALLWLARDEGPAFAAAAAIATLAGSLMQAGFALGYARAARRGGPAIALAAGLAAAVVLAALTLLFGDELAPAAGAAGVGIALCRLAMPAAGEASPPVRATTRSGAGEIALTVTASALLSTLAASLGAHWGPHAAGLLASLPVVCATVAVLEQQRHGPAAAGDFLQSYTNGLFGRMLFGVAFALAVQPCGAVLALVLAIAASVGITALMHGVQHRAGALSANATQRA